MSTKKIKLTPSEKTLSNFDMFYLNVLNKPFDGIVDNKLTYTFKQETPDVAFEAYPFDGTEHYKTEYTKSLNYRDVDTAYFYNHIALNAYLIYGGLYHLNPTVEFVELKEEDSVFESVLLTIKFEVLGDPVEIYFFASSFTNEQSHVVVGYLGNYHQIPTLYISDAIINHFMTGDVIRATETRH